MKDANPMEGNNSMEGANGNASTLRVMRIIAGTTVDGPGLRTTVYLAGCSHHCPGCHNPETWDPMAGEEMTIANIMSEIEENGFNVTLSGGDPLYQIDGITALARQIRQAGYGLWCYTGYTYEAIAAKPEYTELLSLIDVVVDGPFIEAQRDISLHFRGSTNQRLIDCRRSTPTRVVLYDDSF